MMAVMMKSVFTNRPMPHPPPGGPSRGSARLRLPASFPGQNSVGGRPYRRQSHRPPQVYWRQLFQPLLNRFNAHGIHATPPFLPGLLSIMVSPLFTFFNVIDFCNGSANGPAASFWWARVPAIPTCGKWRPRAYPVKHPSPRR